ncbi:MAG: hypothetical protein HXX08_06865 [Chloroflexi bacterium]|uniref:Uncharacterized protein n=1 Tax=Candidatus Chlorohelix allophototropha TaxID=3003348 RepID=A0A8T7LZ45_9CHLR|nr:hypothetical protein [Chloroflexota bacterium]WJW67455.1 hypothetical protein OZ401_000721 [Chloroflexota bacterium L227-S17]
MDGPTQYLQWGFIQISIANLIVIGLLIVVFALAVIARRGEKNRPSTLEALPLSINEKVAKETEVNL